MLNPKLAPTTYCPGDDPGCCGGNGGQGGCC